MKESNNLNFSETGMCPHGNFPESCELCRIKQKHKKEELIPEIEQKKNFIERFRNSKIGRKVKRMIIYSLIVMAGTGIFKAGLDTYRYQKQIDEIKKGEQLPSEKQKELEQNQLFVEKQLERITRQIVAKSKLNPPYLSYRISSVSS